MEVDWRHEVSAARRQRGDSEAESRQPERLTSFHKSAREELGGAGLHLLAERAERLREDWVKKQMVEIGQARAQSLGWPDAYPYTKALGERALVSQFGDVRPHHHHPTVHHRVRPGRAPTRLDPRLPDGRADHHLLRPRACSGSFRACPRASPT